MFVWQQTLHDAITFLKFFLLLENLFKKKKNKCLNATSSVLFFIRNGRKQELCAFPAGRTGVSSLMPTLSLLRFILINVTPIRALPSMYPPIAASEKPARS